jgi:transcriptional regulator with XRE-family HTH domain
MKNIGKKLNSFVRRHYRFFTKFAQALGIHQSTLYKYFDEGNYPNFKLLKQLNYLGCSLNWLLDAEQSIENVPPVKNTKAIKNYKPNEHINIYMGQRLKNFGHREFETMPNFAKALEIRSSTLYNYINGQVLPGTRFLAKLIKLGCNIEWLVSDSQKTDYIPHEFELQKDFVKNKLVVTTKADIRNSKKSFLYLVAKKKFGSVENLAKELGISRQALYPYIHGKPLTKKLLTKLKELGIKMEEEIEQQSTVDNNTSKDSELSKLREIVHAQEELIKSFREIIENQKFLIEEQKEKIDRLEKRMEQKLISHDFKHEDAKKGKK